MTSHRDRKSGMVVGIDLGTSNSCVATFEGGVARIVASAAGERITPSAVAWDAAGQVVVGAPALRQAVSNPTATVFGAKRLIGRKVNTDDVSWFARMAPFRIVAAPNGDAWVRIGSQAVSPQEIASHVLRHLRMIAEEATGEPVTRAVVTVPAYFDEVQRQATRDAGAIAGLDIVRILNEPTAAALAYGAHRHGGSKRRIIAVFDLGGGTFDISIMAIEHGVFEVLATGGDSALGGDDWDRKLMEGLADELFDRHRVDVLTQPLALSRLKEACAAAKRSLSAEREVRIALPYLAQDAAGSVISIDRSLTRTEAEKLTQDLLDRLEEPCRSTLAEAELTTEDIEEVLLVGGMTRWPAVQALVERIFGRKPSKGANPDEVVALGAAAYAANLAGDRDDATLLDVTPHDIGIRLGDSQFVVMIPRNSMLPARAQRLFATTVADQKFVTIELYQGTADQLSKNRKLGQVVLDDLPPGPAGSVRLEVTLTVDVESILSVTAREQKTGRQASVTVRPSGGLSQREMVEIIARRRERERRNSSGHPGPIDSERTP